MKYLTTLLSTLLLSLFAFSTTIAQEVPNPRVSPTMISAITVNDTYVKVVYGMPFKNDREIFGQLVPFNEVWRTGANEATEITLTGDVDFGGVICTSRTLWRSFTIPGPQEWTIILNKRFGSMGCFPLQSGTGCCNV